MTQKTFSDFSTKAQLDQTELYRHNKKFVQKALGYIYASGEGLREGQLLELLSQDEAFVKAMTLEIGEEDSSQESVFIYGERLQTQLELFISTEIVDDGELMYFFDKECDDVGREPSQLRDDHEAVIKVTQSLILKNQNRTFYTNRWGRLYATLITEYEMRYHDKEKQKVFAVFLVDTDRLEKGWISMCLSYMTNLGFVYHRKNQIFKAIAYRESFFYVLKALYEQSRSQWAEDYTLALSNLAASYKKQNCFKEAITLEEESYDIRKVRYEENPSGWAESYNISLTNLAFSYKHTNRLKEAITLMKVSLQVSTILYEENPSKGVEKYTTALSNLAFFYDKQNSLEEAIAVEEKLLKVRKIQYEVDPLPWVDEYSKALSNLAFSYNMQKALEKAIVLEEASLQIRKVQYEANPLEWSERYTTSLSNLAFSYKHTNRLEEAIVLEKESLKIRKARYEWNPSEWAENYATALTNLAFSYDKQNRLEEAITLDEASLKIIKVLYEDNPFEWKERYTTALHALATAKARNSAYASGSGLFEKYFEIMDFKVQDDMRSFIYPYVKWYQCLLRLADIGALKKLDVLGGKLMALYKEKLGLRYKEAISKIHEDFKSIKDSDDDLLREKHDIFVKVFLKE